MTMHRIFTLSLAAGLAAAGAAAAGPDGSGAGWGGDGTCLAAGASPVPAALGPLPRALSRLDLTAEQRDAIRAILAAEGPALQALRRQLRENRQAFRAQHPPTVFDEAAVRAHAEAQGKLRTELAVAAARTRARILQVLTPGQLQQLDQWRAARGGRGQGAGRGAAKGGPQGWW